MHAKALRILLVQYDPVAGSLLGELLTEMGHVVCGIETNEEDAITAARSCAPDLLVVDAFIRKGSSIRLIDAIGGKHRVAHLFLTADIAQLHKAKPSAIAIQIPFRETELTAGIKRAISLSSK